MNLFKQSNSKERIAQIGLKKVYSSRAVFSSDEDSMIISLQKERGNRWVYISAHINEMFETDWSNAQVCARFKKLETKRKQGGRKYRRVDWTEAEDAQLIALRYDWLETHETTYGMWDAIVVKMTGKTILDLKNCWRKLSKSLAATSLEDKSCTNCL